LVVQASIKTQQTMDLHQGVLLFAHGSRDPAWAEPLRRLLQHAKARFVEQSLALAFLEHATPDFVSAAQQLVEEDRCTHIMIRPVFLARGGHLKRDLEALYQEAQVRWPQVQWQISPCLGDSPIMQAAMLDWIGEDKPCA
jgi:sirohydrochlorin cobaltochelatase